MRQPTPLAVVSWIGCPLLGVVFLSYYSRGPNGGNGMHMLAHAQSNLYAHIYLS